MYIILVLLRIATVSISNKRKSSVTVTMQGIAITQLFPCIIACVLGESLGGEYAKANVSVNYVDSGIFRKKDFEHRLLVAR